MRTWLLTGVPRPGTSLCCRLAARLRGVVALNEPVSPGAFDATRPGRIREAACERSYRARGRYGAQLTNLYRHFPRERVLVLRQAHLRDEHDATLRRVFEFLGVAPDVRVPPARVFASGPRPRHRLARALLRLSFLADAVRLRRLGVGL